MEILLTFFLCFGLIWVTLMGFSKSLEWVYKALHFNVWAEVAVIGIFLVAVFLGIPGLVILGYLITG